MRFSIKFSGILSAKCRNQSFGDICGSLGQGTIVHEHYDIDLVLYSTSKLMYKILNKNWAELYAAIMYSHDLGLLPHIRDPMENGYDDILKQLNEYLRTDLETYDFLRMTNVGLKFRIESLDMWTCFWVHCGPTDMNYSLIFAQILLERWALPVCKIKAMSFMQNAFLHHSRPCTCCSGFCQYIKRSGQVYKGTTSKGKGAH